MISDDTSRRRQSTRTRRSLNFNRTHDANTEVTKNSKTTNHIDQLIGIVAFAIFVNVVVIWFVR
jgi:hypothetical protein